MIGQLHAPGTHWISTYCIASGSIEGGEFLAEWLLASEEGLCSMELLNQLGDLTNKV
jgi:hypothetical protein